jgi:putative oxidoreductase
VNRNTFIHLIQNPFSPVGGPSVGQAMLLVLRLVIGCGFFVHGYAKLSRGPEKFSAVLDFIGVPFPLLVAWLVTLVEMLGGIAMMVGVCVTLLSLPLIAIHLVAMFAVHWRYGFSSVNTVGMSIDGPLFGPPGFEVNLLYIGGQLVLATFGAGFLSIDSMLNRRPSPATMTLIDQRRREDAGRAPAATPSVEQVRRP